MNNQNAKFFYVDLKVFDTSKVPIDTTKIYDSKDRKGRILDVCKQNEENKDLRGIVIHLNSVIQFNNLPEFS